MEMKDIKIVDMFDLMPSDSHKSFYGKAKVIIDEAGRQFLRSYETIVAYKDVDGNVHRTWNDWSATTGRHIKSFTGMNKAAFDKLPTEF